jgi:BirA family transcriptional regulator, biotin operon repressor / biotin---[acetyl-CoA-carboxylase] ligase
MRDETERLRALGAQRVVRAEFHESIGSTNDRARELARGGCSAWTLVRAASQAAGRGRAGREWVSPAGGLYLSIVLRPAFPEVGLLPLATGLGVRQALSAFGIDARLKWPNDVMASDRKIAGILAESASGRAGLEWVVLGIGVNLRRPHGSLEGVASSIEEWTPDGVPGADEVSGEIVRAFAGWYDRLEGLEGEAITKAWSAGCLDWEGRIIEGHSGTGLVRGTCRGIDTAGALMLEQSDGTILRLLSGDVRAVRERREKGEGGDSCF